MKVEVNRSAAVRPLAALLCAAFLLFPIGTEADQTSPHLSLRDKTPTKRAFVNAVVVVDPEKRIDSATVVIEQGRIVAVGRGLEPDESVPEVDLEGRWIFPGFIEPYSQYGLVAPDSKSTRRNGPPQYETDREGGNAWNETVQADRNCYEQFRPDAKKSETLMKNGFVVVRSLLQDGVFRGRSFVTLLGDGLPNDLILKPAGSHGVSFSRGSSGQEYPESEMGAIALIRQTFFDADWYRAAQEAFRLNPDQERPEFNAALEALKSYQDLSFVFDSDGDLYSLFRFDRIAEEFGLSYTAVGSGREYLRLADLKEVDPTLILPIKFPEPPAVKTVEDRLDLTLSELRHWERAPGNPARLQDIGVTFAITASGLKNAEEFWKNLHQAVSYGLSQETALAALTTIPAKICGVDDECGSLEPGKLANFFITDGNILESQHEIYSVFSAGAETVLKPLPTTQFAGEYELTVGQRILHLTIEEDSRKGRIAEGDWTEELKSVSTDRNMIFFTVPLDSTESAGLCQFSGRKQAGSIEGMAVLPDGTRVDFAASPIDHPRSPADTSATDETEKKIEFVSRLTYPNVAFGIQRTPAQDEVLFRNATVWTADSSGTLENCDLLIRGGLIAAIGSDLPVGDEVQVMDATGMHITPGIIDAHSHIAVAGDVNEGSHSVTPEVRIGDVIDPDQYNIYRQLAGGVTACLTLHGSANTIGGQCQAIKLRWGGNADEMKFKEAPPTIKFAMGENVKQSNWGDRMVTRYPQTRMGVTNLMADVFEAARDYERSWEIYRSLSSKERERTVPPRKDIGLDAIVELLHDRSLLHCHTYVQSEILALIQLADQYDFGVDVFVHNLEGYKVADEIANHGAGVTTFSDWWAYKFEVYDAIPYNAALLHDRGVLVSLKSDNTDLARRLNQEAGKAVMYGDVSPDEAIKMVTINPARQLGVADVTGSIVEGKQADVVIFNGPPLSVYSSVVRTYVDGRMYFDRDQDMVERERVAAEKNLLIQKVLAEESHRPRKPAGSPASQPRVPDKSVANMVTGRVSR